MLYRILKFIVHHYLRFYYKRIYLNKFNAIPADRPVLIACNHNNAFADALLTGSFLSPLDMHFIVRGDAFNPKMLWFFKKTNQIPIFRFRDGFENLKKNNSTMEYCYDLLHQKKRIIIFSEGNCILENRLRPIQKGTARMAFGSFTEKGTRNIVIIPVGINYIEGLKMRSSVLLNVGKPIEVDDYLDSFQRNPNKAIKELTDDIEIQLKKEVLHIDSAEHEDLAQKSFLLMDNSYPMSFSSFQTGKTLFNRLKTWLELFNLNIEQNRKTWIEGLTQLFSQFNNYKIKINVNQRPKLVQDVLVALLIGPIGLPGYFLFFILISLSMFIVKKIPISKEFFASIHIAVSFLIIKIFALLSVIVLFIVFNWKVAAIGLILLPIMAKTGIMWIESIQNVFQYLKFKSIPVSNRNMIEKALKEYHLK